MPSSALVTQLFSSLMRDYRSFPPVAPITTSILKIASSNDRGLLEQAAGRDVKSEPDELGVFPDQWSS